MFLDDDPETAADAADAPSEITVRALLEACAAEAERQAGCLRQLDAALGAALAEARRHTGLLPHGQVLAGEAQDSGAPDIPAARWEGNDDLAGVGRRSNVQVTQGLLLGMRTGERPTRDVKMRDDQRQSGKTTEGRTLVSALVADLQMADRLRQEAEGLARVLALLARQEDGAGPLRAADIRACSPVAALHRRLLSPVRVRDGAENFVAMTAKEALE